ncbi:lantibiotic dehydratase family protein [Spirosoma montaniterrae]|uniref:lantibiotic dehydratase family protein n=1 Tax=Spirosoma montaniterrae TaxID=1178516 RepID=UPI0018DC5B23|nr:lantibiotic dehydratase family protein [Spirosoma montaniterrae]
MSDLRVGATVSRHLRLDAGLVSQLAHTISQLPYIRRQLSYTTNDSVWVIGDVLHYIGFNEENGQRSYYQNEVKTDACLLQLLENARQGLPYSTLSEQLKQAGVDTDTVMSYLDALIDSQLLVSDLSINLTGPDPLVRLNERLATRSGTGPLVERLTHLQALLPCCGPMSNQQIETLLHELAVSAQPPYVQCDTFLPDDTLVLSTVVQAELGHTLSDLAERSRPSVNSSLDTFKRRFFARYENQAVPLLEALDPDAGIGYDLHQEMPTPWLDSLPWHSEASSAPAETVVSEHLLKLYVSAIQQQEMVIQLTKQDLDTILPVQPNLPLPGSGYAIGQLMGQPNAPDSLFLLKGMGGPSAANLLGRFAHLSPELEARLKQCLQDEQAMYPDALLAELVHLPGARTGNVLRRPILRPHELPILTRSMVPESHQLSLRELRIAVPDGQRVVLLSHRLNQQVIPRLSTAHNVQAGGWLIIGFCMTCNSRKPVYA